MKHWKRLFDIIREAASVISYESNWYLPWNFTLRSFCLSGRTPVAFSIAIFNIATESDGENSGISYSLPFHLTLNLIGLSFKSHIFPLKVFITRQNKNRKAKHNYSQYVITIHSVVLAVSKIQKITNLSIFDWQLDKWQLTSLSWQRCDKLTDSLFTVMGSW